MVYVCISLLTIASTVRLYVFRFVNLHFSIRLITFAHY